MTTAVVSDFVGMPSENIMYKRVDGAIHRGAGPGLLDECRKLGGCHTGEAKITRGHNLPARWIIHTVGPVWHGGNRNEDALLAECYHNCLTLAAKHFLKNVAFPAISTGAYSFPVDRAARIALKQICEFLNRNTLLEKVIVVCFNQETYDAYMQNLQLIAE